MNAEKLITELEFGAEAVENTCDTIKAGDPGRELKRVAVSMFATVELIQTVKEWGADLLIVHEPTYYSHMDRISNDPVSQAKLALVEESGLVIYRYHDHMHFRDIDLITEGELHHLGLEGTVQKTPYKASYILKLQVPVTARELARRMEKELHIAHVRMVGSLDASVTRIAACFGTPQGVFELMKHEDIELVLTGEACEWQLGEYARDAAALGLHKAMIVMGHIGSERDGMRLLAERLQERYDSFETKYFECGEVYEYLDSDR